MAAVNLVFTAPANAPGSPVQLVFGGGVPGAVECVAAGEIATLALVGRIEGGYINPVPAIEGSAAAGVASVGVCGVAAGAHGVSCLAAAQVAGFFVSGTIAAQLVTAATATGAIPFSATLTGAAAAQHPRYELRGQVRLAGNPVERLVRAYRRDTGALLGQGDTTGGFFRIPAGFAEIECTVLPIDLATDATDYEPPTANRVLCVLAEDDA